MFLYDQLSGRLWHRDVATTGWSMVAAGYAGNGEGLSNPLWQAVKNHGPLPVGKYTLTPFNWPSRGPIVFSLLPDSQSNMLSRSGFFVHWDTPAHDFKASDGCIVFRDMPVFQFIQKCVASQDNQLEVVAMPPLAQPPTQPTV